MEYKTDWKPFETVNSEDMNRIERNIANSVQKGVGNAEHIQFGDGETFQEKYDGGKLNGTDGKNATINGLQAIEIVDGANTTVKIADGKMKIDAAKTAVVDNLTSTSSADALSASQGRVLNEKTTAMPTTQPNFSEANETGAAFTDNLAETATLGTGWAGTMPAFTHASGGTGVLSFPVSIANGDFIEIAFTQTGTATDNTFSIVLAANSTAASGQTVKAGVFYNTTFVIQATGNYGYVNIVPAGTWAGAFTLTHIKKAVSLNSHSVSVKSFPKIVRNATVAEGGGGRATTSGNNIALGSDALFFNTSGNYNTAIGNNTLRSNTTGICNNAFGSQSLLNNTSGTYNVGLGTQTLERNISGSNNIGIGHYALSSNVTGGGNIGIGALAMAGNVVGNNNVGIGYSSLYNLTGGGFNVGIGSHAGIFLSNGSTAQTNASNSLFIGYNSKGASSDSQTNQIVIGYNAAGNGSNTITLGNSSITKLLCQVTEISALSDSRVKDDQGLANLEMCYDAVRSLPVHRYRYKAFTGRHLDTNVTGFMADDVERIFPKAVQRSNQYFPVLDENGGAVYEEIAETVTEIDAEGNEVQVEKTRRAEKMFLMEDVKDITMTEALPTLWGAVQALMEKVEKLEEKLA